MRVRALFVLAAVVAVGPGGTVSPAATVHAAPVLTNPVIFVKQTPPGLGISVPGNPYADLKGFFPPLFQPLGGNLFRLDPDGTLTNLTRRADAAVRNPEISYDGLRVLFAMRVTVDGTWQIYEMNVDGSAMKRVSRQGIHNDLDPAYLPDGRIVFTSDRQRILDPYIGVPSAQLHVMNADGTGVTQISSNPGGEMSPQVTSTGHVSFIRWDVRLGIPNRFSALDVSRFQLWRMAPDGTNNAHPFFGPHTLDDFEGGYLQARELPGGAGKFVATQVRDPFTAGAGALVTLDPAGDQDLHQPKFLTDELAFTGVVAQQNWRDPYPLIDGRVLASLSQDQNINGFFFQSSNFALAVFSGQAGVATSHQVIYDDPVMWDIEPVEVAPRPVPPVLASTLDLEQDWGILNARDVTLRGKNPDVAAPDFQGLIADAPGLKVRIFKGVRGNGDRFQLFEGYGKMRQVELGDVAVRDDGSFAARVPANTPIVWEVLDAGGRRLVKDRFWNQVLPSQVQSCNGCHSPHDGTPGRTTNFALAEPTDLTVEDPRNEGAQVALVGVRAVVAEVRGLMDQAQAEGHRTRKQRRRIPRIERLLVRAERRLLKGRPKASRRYAELAGRKALGMRGKLRKTLGID